MKQLLTMALLIAAQLAFAMQISLPAKSGVTLQAAKKELQEFLGGKKNMPDFVLKVDPSLREEAWKIDRKSSSAVTITAGSPHGVYYGVIEFLERFQGIRFYGPEHTYIPEKTAKIPANIKISGEPSMRFRMHSAGAYRWICSPNAERWYARNRVGAPGIPNRSFSIYGSPARCHTYGVYTTQKDFPDDITCHALTEDGKRLKAVSGVGPGNPCTTHPKVRAYFKRKLREFILADRKKAKARGIPYPKIYSISGNDNRDVCRCKNCKAAWKRTGGPGGNDLDFVNYLAKSIEKEFPDVVLECFAYMYSERPDKVKAHPQVQVQIAQLGGEYNGKRRTMLSLYHPENAESLADIRRWTKFAQNLAIWDYCTLYKERFPSPYTKVRCYADTMKEYYACGVKSVYWESEVTDVSNLNGCVTLQSFCDLKNYTAMRFLIDKNTDVESLIDDYMRHTYGPAAGPMKKLLALIEKAIAGEKNMNRTQTQFRKYLNKEFFLAAEKLLNEAEKAVANDKKKLQFVRVERFPFDYAMLGCYYKLQKENFPLKAKDIAARLAPIEEWIIKNTYFSKYVQNRFLLKNGEARRKKWLTTFTPSEPPAFLKDYTIAADYSCDNFNPWSACKIVKDPDSFNGKAFVLGPDDFRNYKNIHSRPFELGLYDTAGKRYIASKKFKAHELPQDEKFHWHAFKNVTLSKKCRMWGHYTWALTPVGNLEDAFDAGMPEQKYDVWISYKVTGPAYVKNSKKPNTLSIDRVIVVASKEPGKEIPDFLKGRKITGDFHVGNFDKTKNAMVVTDPEAYRHAAVSIGSIPPKGQKAYHKTPFELGVYDIANKKVLKRVNFRWQKVPQDEKYNWLVIKNITLSKKCRIWGTDHWVLSPVTRLERAFDPAAPEKKYDICISYKLTGPAYVKGSKKENTASIDRVIVVEAK